MTRPRSVTFVWVAAAALFAGGCGKPTATVSGRVTCNGKPLTGGSVILYCADKQIVHGIIGPDGRYTIPNVPRGSAVVTVRAHPRTPAGLQIKQSMPPVTNGPKAPTDGSGELPPTPIPPRYALSEESGLSLVVDRDQLAHDIDLKP
jgi:hypothetical protein